MPVKPPSYPFAAEQSDYSRLFEGFATNLLSDAAAIGPISRFQPAECQPAEHPADRGQRRRAAVQRLDLVARAPAARRLADGDASVSAAAAAAAAAGRERGAAARRHRPRAARPADALGAPLPHRHRPLGGRRLRGVRRLARRSRLGPSVAVLLAPVARLGPRRLRGPPPDDRGRGPAVARLVAQHAELRRSRRPLAARRHHRLRHRAAQRLGARHVGAAARLRRARGANAGGAGRRGSSSRVAAAAALPGESARVGLGVHVDVDVAAPAAGAAAAHAGGAAAEPHVARERHSPRA